MPTCFQLEAGQQNGTLAIELGELEEAPVWMARRDGFLLLPSTIHHSPLLVPQQNSDSLSANLPTVNFLNGSECLLLQCHFCFGPDFTETASLSALFAPGQNHKM